MNNLFMDFLTILLPTYFFFYMAITLIYRNPNSMINRIAALLMGALLSYFLFEYLKTSLLPEYQVQLVLYGSSPSLLLIISTLVHLSVLLGEQVTYSVRKWLPLVYAAPYTLWMWFLVTWDHHRLYNVNITDGRSPLDPTYLLMTLSFLIGYILLSVVLLSVSWHRTKELKKKRIFRSLVLSVFGLLGWFIVITGLLQSGLLITRVSMICYFIGYFLWAVKLRHLIGKYNIMPDYRKLFQSLFESAPNAILLVDLKGNVKEMNPRAMQWFNGIPLEEISNFFELENGKSLEELLASYLHHPDYEAHWEVRIKDAHRADLNFIAGIDLIAGTNEDLFVLHLTNVTSLKEIERQLIQSEQTYKHNAYHDVLTGLYNRAGLEEQIQQRIEQQEEFVLVLIDLNQFKPINDTYGHVTGDLYLQYVADLLRSLIHKQGDAAFRIGGDEFVIVLACPEHTTPALMAETRLSLLNNKLFVYEDKRIAVSFAAGISMYPADAQDLTGLIRVADEEMYKRKRQSKNRHELWIREV